MNAKGLSNILGTLVKKIMQQISTTKVEAILAKLFHWNREIQSLDQRQNGGLDMEITKAERELNKLLEEEEMYWKLKSREDWLQWGDKNTMWFHSKASQRKRKNSIEGIKDAQGRWVEDEEEIGMVAVEYFRSLFSSTRPDQNALEEATQNIKARVTDNQRRELSCPFNKVEIEKALKEMNPSKASGR